MSYRLHMPKPFLNLSRVFFFILLIAVAGCQARLQDTGTMIKPEDIDKIVVGVTNYQEVRKLLGPATIVNTFRRERWIYIQDRRYKNLQRTFSRAANRIEITFNNQGIVEKIERNFGDKLMDPEKDKYSELKSRWGSWFWDGGYEKPASQQQDSPKDESESEDDKENSEADAVVNDPDKEETKGEENNADAQPTTDTAKDGEVADEKNTKEAKSDDDTSQKAKAWWRFW
ncbi:MAG: outer membrane protein assembly factor BamE [Magnetococcales bacterium]|nr:outer membrane protein assembly factor BamE [Magnetococcales bacterium]